MDPSKNHRTRKITDERITQEKLEVVKIRIDDFTITLNSEKLKV